MPDTYYVTIREMIESLLPDGIIELPEGEALDQVWIEPLDIREEPELVVSTSLLFQTELAVGIPGLDAVKLVFAGAGLDTVIPLEFRAAPVPQVRLVEVPIAIRFSRDLLKPARRETGSDGSVRVVEDTATPRVDITLARITFSVDLNGNIGVQSTIGIDLPLCLIGSSGVAVEARGIRIHLGLEDPPPGKPQGWRGVHIPDAALFLPGDLGHTVGNLELADAFIGDGGFTGDIRDTWRPPLSASLFGMTVALSSVEIGFVQNAFTRCAIAAKLRVPFFQPAGSDPNHFIDVAIGVSGDGGFTFALAGGLAAVRLEGVVAMSLESLSFEAAAGAWWLGLSGTVQPLIAGWNWPAIRLQDLKIDQDGRVRLEGGWLDLPSSYSVSFSVFTITVRRIGFGNSEGGGHFIGFSGGLRLVDGLEAGARVDGLKVTWYDDTRPPNVTLEGVAVELEIPNVLRFAGEVAYRELPEGRRFEGRLALSLIALDLQIDARVVIGSHEAGGRSYQYLAVYVEVNLPVGIPLASTGLGLYGFAGLFALNMEPNKAPDQAWYSTGRDDWFHTDPVGVEGLTKWANREHAFALGAGVTLGTLSDNGYTFAGKFLLLFIFPGPIIMLQGKANLLKQRSTLDRGEPLFRVLAVLDFRAGTVLVGLDLHYLYEDDGSLLDLRGSAEAFFDFNDVSAWHIWLGEREPRERRIRAQLLNRLLAINAYFQIDAHHFAMGAWAGIDQRWAWGPLVLALQFWIEFNLALNYKPTQLHGDIALHGSFSLRIFGIGFEFILDASLAGDTPNPWHVVGHLEVGVRLPFPLPSFQARVGLEWGPIPDVPPIPTIVQEVSVEHLKSSTVWPLLRGSLLMPDHDDGAGFLRVPPPAAHDEGAPPPAAAPVVPLDARPRITFGRSVHDDAGVGVNSRALEPEYERIGDPARNVGPMRVRYALRQLTVEVWEGRRWRAVAAAGGGAHPPGVERLFGSWAPVPALPSGGDAGDDGQTKLWLWSNNPFDYTRRTGGAYEEGFAGSHPDYPCPPPPRARTRCVTFDELFDGELPSGWEHPDEPGLVFEWGPGGRGRINPAGEKDSPQTFCFHGQKQALFLMIRLPRDVAEVRLQLDGPAWGDAETPQESAEGYWMAAEGELRFTGQGISSVTVQGDGDRLCVRAICLVVAPSAERLAEHARDATRLREQVRRWGEVGPVLLPFSQYRIKVVTAADAIGEAELAGRDDRRTVVEYAFFRTEGPPGLANLSLPAGTDDSQLDGMTLRASDGAFLDVGGAPSPRRVLASELNDLSRYVAATIPDPTNAPLTPAYRGYDASVRFNENYVDLMYRAGERDLGLFLFDRNNQPVRDAAGRIVVWQSIWDRAAETLEHRSDRRWDEMLRSAPCALPAATRPASNVLGAPAGWPLDPRATYEGRLMPLLLHDYFSSGLDGWQVVDETADGGASAWRAVGSGTPPAYALTQGAATGGGSPDPASTDKPGALLLRPAGWTDVRFGVFAEFPLEGLAGVVFRCRDAANSYRWILDRGGQRYWLARVADGRTTVLSRGHVPVPPGAQLTVEVIGPRLRAYLDDRAVVDLVDEAPLPAGGCGFYTWRAPGTRFVEARVEDFSPTARVVFRFSFTTSGYTSFLHHLHSFDDETWPIPSPAEVPAAALAAADGALPPDEAEHRAYDAVEAALLPASRAPIEKVEVARLDRGDDGPVFVVRSPEPFDWARLRWSLSAATGWAPGGEVPGTLKLTDAALAEPGAAVETVSVLARDGLDLTGARVEYRRMAEPVDDDAGAPLLEDDFDVAPVGLPWRELFRPDTRDHWELSPAPEWFVIAGRSLAYTGAGPASALWRSAPLGDVNVRVAFASEAAAAGLFLRYQDDANHLRVELTAREHRVIERADGVDVVLARLSASLAPGRRRVVAMLWGEEVLVEINETHVLTARQTARREGDGGRTARTGRVGLFTSGGQIAIERVVVEEQAGPLFLWRPEFADLSGIERFQDAPPREGWRWHVRTTARGALLHGPVGRPEALRGSSGGPPPVKTGGASTLALAGDASWQDVRISARITTTNRAGVALRWVDESHHLRFEVAGQAGRLVRRAGRSTTLWSGRVRVVPGKSFNLVLDVKDGRARGWINGQEVFDVAEPLLASGRVGLLSGMDSTSRFENVVVVERTRWVGQWRVRDQGGTTASVWRLGGGELALGLPGGGETWGVTGEATWTDVRVSARLALDLPGAAGVLVSHRSPTDWLRVGWDSRRGVVEVVRRSGASTTLLGQVPSPAPPGAERQLTVDVVGARLLVNVDGAEVLDTPTAGAAEGAVGVWAEHTGHARFTDFVVERVPVEARALLRDRFETGSVAGWRFSTSGGASAWEAGGRGLRHRSEAEGHAVAGDTAWTDIIVQAWVREPRAGGAGVVARRLDEGTFYAFLCGAGQRSLVRSRGGTVDVLWRGTAPPRPGAFRRLCLEAQGSTLRGFIDGVPAFVVADEAIPHGALALYSTGGADAEFYDVSAFDARDGFSGWLLDESFDLQAPSRWTASGEDGWTLDFGRISHVGRGESVALVGDAQWADYRVSAPLGTSARRGAVGLVFRARDEQNHHRLVLDFDAGQWRLVRRLEGADEVLRRRPAVFSTGRDHVVTVDADGGRIRAYIDGVEVVSVVDGARSGSLVGLFAAGSPLSVREVRVAAPKWATYHRFARLAPVPAGSVAVVCSPGPLEAALPTGRGTLHVATVAGRPAWPRLGRGAQLRIRAQREERGHARWFGSEHTAVPVRVLRKRDGTGLVLVVSGGRPAVPYRLEGVFSRESPPVLSERGDASPERVHVDIPWARVGEPEVIPPLPVFEETLALPTDIRAWRVRRDAPA